MNWRSALLIAALVAGTSYYASHWIDLPQPWYVIWKGLGVGLLAAWAASRARSTDGWLIAAVLGLHAVGDVVLETHGLIVGAIGFLAGHSVALVLYLRNRQGPVLPAIAIALLVAGFSYLLPANRADAPGIALYALGLGVMAGAASISRFPRTVVFGALLFVISDLLIFADLGPLADSAIPGLLIWPTYFAGQALIAWGVVTALERR